MSVNRCADIHTSANVYSLRLLPDKAAELDDDPTVLLEVALMQLGTSKSARRATRDASDGEGA